MYEADWTSVPGRALVRFHTELTLLERVCSEARTWFEAQGSREGWFGLHLLLRELANNALLHGNGLDPRKTVEIRLEHQTDAVLLEVSDEGPGFAFPRDRDSIPEVTADSGRGLGILRHYASVVQYHSPGNRVTVTYPIKKEKLIMEVLREGGRITVRTQGDVVSQQALELRRELKPLMDEPCQEFVLDLAQTELMDSLGLGVLIALQNHLGPKGIPLKVIHLGPDLIELFKNMRLDRHFEIAGT